MDQLDKLNTLPHFPQKIIPEKEQKQISFLKWNMCYNQYKDCSHRMIRGREIKRREKLIFMIWKEHIRMIKNSFTLLTA